MVLFEIYRYIYCHSVIDSYDLDKDQNHDSKYGILVTPNIENNWEIGIGGWLTENQYSSSPKKDFFKINVTDKEIYKEFKIRNTDNLNSFIGDYHKDRAENDLYIRKAFVEEAEVSDILIKKYFLANST